MLRFALVSSFLCFLASILVGQFAQAATYTYGYYRVGPDRYHIGACLGATFSQDLRVCSTLTAGGPVTTEQLSKLLLHAEKDCPGRFSHTFNRSQLNDISCTEGIRSMRANLRKNDTFSVTTTFASIPTALIGGFKKLLEANPFGPAMMAETAKQVQRNAPGAGLK